MKKLFAEELLSFPDPRLALDQGIVDVSDEISVERLLEDYSFGIFPWPHPELPTLWFCPEERGILPFSDFHISKSLQKLIDKNIYTYSFNQAFSQVLDACSKVPRVGQSGTWITERLKSAYQEFHEAGYAHSLEVWSGPRLVGGLYGVYVGGVFGGESMFHLEPNTSKLAVVQLVQFLKSQGLEWMDIQMVTPVLKNFGGRYIERNKYLQLIKVSRKHAHPIEFKI